MTHTIITLIMLVASLLYLALGLEYTTTLRERYKPFRNAIDKCAILYAVALLGWFPMFIFTTLLYIGEVLTKSRKNDYIENQLDNIK